MKNILFLLFLLFLLSCKKDIDTATVPAYIQIDSILFSNESITTNITDAWIYIDEQLQGVYEIPVIFPVLEEGVHLIRVKAGIKSNGIATSRISYPFYSSFLDSLDFISDKISILNPEVGYLDSINDDWIEDFEDLTFGPKIEKTDNSESDLIEFASGPYNLYAGGILNDSLMLFEVSSEELKNLPQAGAPVFLELDYKCNTSFLVGVYTNYPQSVVSKDILLVNPKNEWNKIYINLTQTISEGINASSFKIFISMRRDFTLISNEVYFDNIKLLY